MMRVAGKSKVKAVQTAEYHKAPGPIEKSGAQTPNPGM